MCAFGSYIDLCIDKSTFSTGNESAIFCNHHAHAFFFTFYMQIYAYFGGRSNTLGVDIVLGINRPLFQDIT